MTNTTRIALVTGANKGIGLEVTRQLAQKGFHVLLGSRDAERGQAAAKSLAGNGVSVEAIALDVANEASAQAAAGLIANKHGHIDVLVNNAGVNEDWGTRPSDISPALLGKTLETNLFGVIRVSKAMLPLLRKSTDARIINVSSTWGSLNAMSHASPAAPSYHISKAALNMWTILLSKDLAAGRIQVNSICPGWVKTDMGSEAAPRTVEQGAAIIIKLATMDAPPTGGFFDDAGPVAW